MARRFTHYDIVISCPSDMTEERATVQRAVDDVNERNANYRGLHFDVKYWDKDVLFCSGELRSGKPRYGRLGEARSGVAGVV